MMGATFHKLATSPSMPSRAIILCAVRARRLLSLKGRPRCLPRRLASAIFSLVRREITARSYSAQEAVSMNHLRPSGVRVSIY